MPSLVDFRPAPLTNRLARPASSPPGRASSWRGRAADWLRLKAAAFGPKGPNDPDLEQFAGLAAMAREPDEVRVALVRLAAEISGADRVELLRERGGHSARRLACWPLNAQIDPIVESGSTPRGPFALTIARARGSRPAPPTLVLTLKAGEIPFGTLRLTARDHRPWPAGADHRLRALCAIAASAERALASPSRGESGPRLDPESGPQGSAILGAFLGFAHAQARRRHEPLSLLEVAIDRLGALRELLGNELAEMALDRVDRAVKATIRASDIVARLEDGRLAVILPNASAENAMKVAEAIRSAIARAGAASTTMPTLTASIGVATFPDHALDLATLRAAAATALTHAETHGHDQIAEAPALASSSQQGQLVG
jgi:diguanylate cyclase (GGDEF)-like protein